MSGALSELYDGEGAEQEAVVETQPTEESAPKESTDSSTPAASDAQSLTKTPANNPAAVATEPKDHSVPLNVLLRTREELGGKLSAVEQRAAAAEAKLAEIRRKQEEAAAQMPSPLEDPDAFAGWLLKQQNVAVQREIGTLSSRHQQQVEVISRNMMQRYLGPEKFGDLQKFIDAAPDEAHEIALTQPDPYGWFYEKQTEFEKARKAEAALSALGEKSLDERIAEAKAQAIAEARAQWEAEHGGGQTQAASPVDGRARNSDGTFVSPAKPQRHQPQSLSAVNGAPVVTGRSHRGSALEELYG